MKRIDVICPLCGRRNRNLYLEETHGWMECEGCLALVKDENFSTTDAGRIPLYAMTLCEDVNRAATVMSAT